LVNALAHRDYASFSSGATVLVYPAHVKIWNSGRLPLGWRADKLRMPHASIPANPDIAHFLYIRSYMERIGRGTNKMIETCREMGLPAPAWAVDEDGITLTLHSRASIEAPELNLNKRQNRLLAELNPGSSITLSDYLKRFADDVGDRQARRDLKELEGMNPDIIRTFSLQRAGIQDENKLRSGSRCPLYRTDRRQTRMPHRKTE
jgi:ATP-dependent DNA helicase RecG